MKNLAAIKKNLMAAAVVAFALTISTASAQTTNWKIDSAHSEAGFTVRHMGISNVRGHFSNLNGSVVLNEKDVTKSSVNATIDITTVDTGNSARDNHLKSPDFFDAAQFPKMTFVSKQIVKKGSGLSLVGDLTLHGVTRQVELALEDTGKVVTDQKGGAHRGFSAAGSINRQDFGMKFGGKTPGGDAMVSDDVKITLEIELIKQ